jgi:hypothetical protein
MFERKPHKFLYASLVHAKRMSELHKLNAWARASSPHHACLCNSTRATSMKTSLEVDGLLKKIAQEGIIYVKTGKSPRNIYMIKRVKELQVD